MATLKAMETMGVSPEEQGELISVTAGVLHLGNIIFSEDANNSEQARVHLSESTIFNVNISLWFSGWLTTKTSHLQQDETYWKIWLVPF